MSHPFLSRTLCVLAVGSPAMAVETAPLAPLPTANDALPTISG